MNNFSIQSIYTWYRNTIRNPKYRWWMILGTALYLVSPINMAYEFIPVIGQLDDVVLLTLLVSEVSQLLIDGVKARQGEKVVDHTVDATEKTVDVDAVSVGK